MEIINGGISEVVLTELFANKYTGLFDLYWMREIYILELLSLYNHSNIIRINDKQFVNYNNKGCIKLNLTKGETTLDYLIKNHYDFTPEEIIQITLDIISAVYVMHVNKIWHRDIKPSNILINKGRAVIIDFSHGVKYNDDIVQLDKCVYSMDYRAKEVFEGDYNGSSDIYAIGIVIFEMLISRKLSEYISVNFVEDDFKRFAYDNCKKILSDIIKDTLGFDDEDLTESKINELKLSNDINNDDLNDYKLIKFIIGLVKDMVDEKEKRPSAESLYNKITLNDEVRLLFKENKIINPTFNDGLIIQVDEDVKLNPDEAIEYDSICQRFDHIFGCNLIIKNPLIYNKCLKFLIKKGYRMLDEDIMAMIYFIHAIRGDYLEYLDDDHMKIINKSFPNIQMRDLAEAIKRIGESEFYLML